MQKIRIIGVVVLACLGIVAMVTGFGALIIPVESATGPCGRVWFPAEPAPAGCGEQLGSLADFALIMLPASIAALIVSSWWSAKLLERFLPWPPG